MTLKWTTAAISDPGGRADNQDYCMTWQHGDGGCSIVADGLGGHRGGKLAARVVGESLLDAWQHGDLSRAWLTGAFAQAQEKLRRQQDEHDLHDMRTTVVMLIRYQNQALWGHVGDSRCYHFRGDAIESITRDHSVPQMLVLTGEIEWDQIRHHPDRNLLLRTLGGHEPVMPATPPAPLTVQPGDAFLLCSDGFWDHLLEAEMEADLRTADSADAWLEDMVRRLRARATGSFDNFSAIATMTKNIGLMKREDKQ